MKTFFIILITMCSIKVAAQTGELVSSMYAVPVPSGSTSSIILTTTTTGISFAQVWLSINGGTPTRLYTGINRTYTYNAIANGSNYKFILYNATSNNAANITTILDTIEVNGIPPVTIGTGFNFFMWQYYFDDLFGWDVNKTNLYRKMLKFQLDGLKQVNCSYIRSPIFWGDIPHYWINTSTRAMFWESVDRMMDDLDERNLKLIPSLLFNLDAIPSYYNVSGYDFVKNDNTPARNAYYQFLAEFVNRYKNRSTILFYEITNELSLATDFNPDYLTTNQMNAFFKRSCEVIRANDPYHMISNGNGMPRPYAYNLRFNNAWILDTPTEYSIILNEQNKYCDIVSIHFYPDDEKRFGYTDSTSVLSITKNYTDSMKKLLYIGEYGETTATTSPNCIFGQSVLNAIEANTIPFSAHWIWSYYTFDTYTLSGYGVESSLNPEFSMKFMQVNQGFGNGDATLSNPDILSPKALITWPLTNINVNASTPQLVNVLAMDNNLNINKVELYINDVKIGEKASWPFQFNVEPCLFSKLGSNQIKAIAFDNSGNVGEDSIFVNNTNNYTAFTLNTILTTGTTENGWTYYQNPANNQIIFGIEHIPSGLGANTNNFTVEVTASSLNCSNSYFFKTQNQEGIFASKDFFNTKVTSATKTNGWVNIRWFIDPLSLTNLSNASNTFATSSGANYVSPLLWLKKKKSRLTLNENLRSDGLGTYYANEKMEQNGTGTVNGQQYYEFKQVSNLDGTGGAAFKRVSSKPTSDAAYDAPVPIPSKKGSIRFNPISKTFEGHNGTEWLPLH
ncbi:Ig-like domain-containing protein [Lacihabitans soyangensis]|nr:Ig-like domain-containing protein [Lacihabitans soyangensis]